MFAIPKNLRLYCQFRLQVENDACPRIPSVTQTDVLPTAGDQLQLPGCERLQGAREHRPLPDQRCCNRRLQLPQGTTGVKLKR